MKKSFIAVLGTFSLLLGASVYAETTPPVAAPVPAPPVAAPATAVTPAPEANQFSERKQKLLENISVHIAKMQKRQTCIEAATDEKALSACRLGENETSHGDSENKAVAAPAPSPATPKP